MQLRYLNFHKLLSNFAGNLVGAFVALIVYQYTHSFSILFLFLCFEYSIKICSNLILKKLYFSKPQLMLLYRIITMVLYNVCILFIDKNIYLFSILTYLFKGVDTSIDEMSKEIIYNYSSLNKDSGSLGFTRLIEKIGIVCATLVGGFLLDINKTIVICIALGIYSISLIPLLMFYFKSKNSIVFNKDATSNAMETLNNNEGKSKGFTLTKEFLFRYFIVYFLFAFIDVTPVIFKLFVFSTGGKYAIVGIYAAIYEISYGLGGFIFGKIDEKKDTTKLVILGSIALGLVNILLVVFKVPVILGVLFFLIGTFMPMLSIYVLQRYLTKSRILGVSNIALLQRNCSCASAYILLYGFGAIFNMLLPVFILVSVGMELSAFAIPYNEEKTRKILVDVLQNNEIRASDSRKKKQLKVQTNPLSEEITKNDEEQSLIEEVEIVNKNKGEKDNKNPKITKTKLKS